jgi:hypothetical protein
MDQSPELGLADVLESLRDELERAWNAGLDRHIKFTVSEVTLAVETVIRKEKDGSGKIKWWVIEAGAAGKSGQERTQTLTLRLTPLTHDGPLNIGDIQQTRPL